MNSDIRLTSINWALLVYQLTSRALNQEPMRNDRSQAPPSVEWGCSGELRALCEARESRMPGGGGVSVASCEAFQSPDSEELPVFST